MSDADKMVKRLRDEAEDMPPFMHDLLSEAADMIEAMAQRIEADDKAYKELERRHAD